MATRRGKVCKSIDDAREALKVIVGPRGVADGLVEIKERATGNRETMSPEAAVNRLASEYPR